MSRKLYHYLNRHPDIGVVWVDERLNYAPGPGPGFTKVTREEAFDLIDEADDEEEDAYTMYLVSKALNRSVNQSTIQADLPGLEDLPPAETIPTVPPVIEQPQAPAEPEAKTEIPEIPVVPETPAVVPAPPPDVEPVKEEIPTEPATTAETTTSPVRKRNR